MVFLKEYFQIKNWIPYDQPQRKRILTFVLWSTLVAGILLGLVNLYLKAYGAGLILFAMSLLCIAGLRLNHYGHFIAAGILVSLMVLIALDANLIDGNGTRDTGIVALPIFVMVGSLLFGKRSVPGFTLGAVGSAILVTYLSVHGDIPRAYHASFNDGITISILIVVSAVLTWVVMETLEKDVQNIRLSETNLRTTYDLVLQNLEKLEQAEGELRESEEKFRRLFETSRDFLYITDMEGKLIETNKAASTLSGYSFDELRKINIQELYFDAQERDILIKKILERGFVENYEIKGRKKDGIVVDTLVNSTVIKGDDGNVVGFQGSIKDISELKRAEKALRESSIQYRTLVENTPDVIARFDKDVHYLFVNKAISQVSPLKPDDFIGKTLKDVGFPKEQAEQREILLHRVIDSGMPIETELEAATTSGLQVFEWRAYPEFDPMGKVQSVLVINRNITERKQAEAVLLAKETHFRALIENSTDAILLVNSAWIILYVSPSHERITGFLPEQRLGRSLFEVVHPDDYETAFQLLAGILPEPGQVNLPPIRAHHADGSWRWIEAVARNLLTESSVQAVVINFRDITERKQAENNLNQQLERLSALHTIDQAVITSMDLNTILKLLVWEIVEQLQVDAASVLLLNPQTQTLDFAASRGFRTAALKFTNLKIGTGLAGKAAQERKIECVANLAEMDNNPRLANSIAKEKFVAYFGVPLIAKGELRGVMEIFHRSALAPDPNWLAFLETLAGQAAISIDNARLLEMTQGSLKEINALYRINQDLVATTDAEQLMKNVVALLQENFGYAYVQIFVVEAETGDFVVRAGSGKIGEQLISQGYRLATGEGIVGLTAETGKPFFTNDVNQVISFVRNPLLPDAQSELAVPVKTGAKFLGLIDIHQMPPATLTERDVQLVSAVADQLAVALQKARLYTDLQNSLRQEQETRSQLVHAEKLVVAGRLLASVSHELNNPLQAIQNALFLLRDEGGLSEQGQQDLKIVLSEAERMATLLDRLRVTYQPARAEDFKLVQINNIIEDVHALVATHLRHARISFEFHSDPDLPLIPGLDDQLKQVMLNLFMNAVDAMSGGGCLIASTSWLAEQREILINVTDTGTGIDESILPNIFEAFITNKEKGTGLGLAVSYEIVLKHHGRIQAENNPESGATFSIWLPAGNGGVQ